MSFLKTVNHSVRLIIRCPECCALNWLLHMQTHWDSHISCAHHGYSKNILTYQIKKPFANKFAKSFPFDNSMLFELSNGDKEIRTPDPLLARQVLSQLSYTPINRHPPTLPYRYQYSTIGRLRLNHRVRDGNGCVP